MPGDEPGRAVPDAVIAEVAESIGQATNNEAEYHAVLRGLAEAKTRGYGRVRMYSDSQLVVRQVRGEWACREERLGRLRGLVAERSGMLDSFELVWIPRTQNTAADQLATEALDALLGRGGNPRHGRNGRQDELTFHNFQRAQEENQRLREENRQMSEEIQTMKNENLLSQDASVSLGEAG